MIKTFLIGQSAILLNRLSALTVCFHRNSYPKTASRFSGIALGNFQKLLLFCQITLKLPFVLQKSPLYICHKNSSLCKE